MLGFKIPLNPSERTDNWNFKIRDNPIFAPEKARNEKNSSH